MDPEDDKDDSSDMDYTPHDFNEEVVRTGPHGGAKVDPEAVSATPVPGTAVPTTSPYLPSQNAASALS